ncbi:hypothetical protein JNUCC1_01138 [Lentibacillus sp. JNUCC-1]|uniref:nuclease-related domain-containing protein n=1 Tax=Lentibacillus sp. JNUCC-1 TaxID=2654513 RepID=UPI0012E98CA8|nr:nuclease-related domain-containing protein [Lentibacillus sp. JNUCC-1]MUV37332.1 hypothetical protein [Lentibacillus sp. JNUCC-1]
MFIENRPKPYTLLKYEALLRKLLPKHRSHPLIQKDYAKHAAGFQGEKYVDYTLSIHPLPDSAAYPGVRLRHKRHPFQIDTPLITPGFVLLMEIKNMTGELSYDSTHDQFIQTIGAERKRQRNPIQQSTAHKLQFGEWLKSHSFPSVPIETLSVISNPNAIINHPQADQTIFDQLIHVEALPEKLQELAAKHPQNILSSRDRRKLYNLLKTHDEPLNPDLIAQYNLNDSHFIKGIPCEHCQAYPLKRVARKWVCQNCGFMSHDAHVQVILDSFLLGKPTITNSECRSLLNYDSRSGVLNLLKKMNLRTSGNQKGVKYHAPLLHDYPQDTPVPINARTRIG